MYSVGFRARPSRRFSPFATLCLLSATAVCGAVTLCVMALIGEVVLQALPPDRVADLHLRRLILDVALGGTLTFSFLLGVVTTLDLVRRRSTRDVAG